MNLRNKDYYGGALMMTIGLAAAYQGMHYPVGTLARMGPGFFPLALGLILACVGLAIAVSGRWATSAADLKPRPPEWRGWFCICASIVAFAVIGKYGGLLPATFAIVFIAALGDRQNTLLNAVVLASAISLICVIVFWWGLQLQLPLFGWG